MYQNPSTITNLGHPSGLAYSANVSPITTDQPTTVNKNDVDRLIDEAVFELQILERKAQSTFPVFKHPLIAKLKKLKTDLSVNTVIVK